MVTTKRWVMKTPNVDLQDRLIKALAPLRKEHPKINDELPLAGLIGRTVLENGNYLKGFWTVWMLVSIDPAIMKDKKSQQLKEFALFCIDHIKLVDVPSLKRNSRF